MPSVISCPKCLKHLAVPELAGPETDVRCPLCDAEYKLAQAWPEGAPELLIIGGPLLLAPTESAIGSDFDDLALGTEAGGSSPTMVATTAGEISFSPHADGEVAFDEHPAAAAGDEEHSVDPMFDSVPGGESGVAVAEPRTKKKPRRRTGPVGRFIGIVVSGIIGLGLGYGILKLIKPEAVRPLDDKLAAAWASVSSYWSGEKSAEEPKNQPTPPINVDGSKTATDGTAKPSAPVTPPGAEKPEIAKPVAPPPSSTVAASQEKPAEPPGVSAPDAAKGTPEEDISGAFGGLPENIDLTAVQRALHTAQAEMDKDPGALNGKVYKAMCDVGHATALVDQVPGRNSGASRRAAGELMRTLATPPTVRKKVGEYAQLWLTSKDRPDERSGVLLIGRVEKITPLTKAQNSFFRTEVSVQGEAAVERVTVLTISRPAFHVHDTAGVLGTIVKQPTSRLPWFTGNEPQVVLSHVTVKLGGK